MIGIFWKPFVVRRHGKQKVVNGHAQAPYTDDIARLNVQPQAPDSFEGREAGDVTVKHLKAWGPDALTSADELQGIPGDLLFYRGAWYECKSSAKWDHTPLRHYQSDFVILPAAEQPKPPEVKP